MTKLEIVGEVHFGSETSPSTWPIISDQKEVGTLFKDDGYKVRLWLHGDPYIRVSLHALSAISQERSRRSGHDVIPPSFWLDFSGTMDPHSLDIKRDGKSVGMLQWHDDFLAVFYASPRHSVDVIISVNDIDQILRKREDIVSKQRTK